MRLYNNNVKSVLLYGSECWRLIKGNMKKIEVFHNNCISRIWHIFWPERISNVVLYKSYLYSVVKWLGHVLRMDQNCIPKVPMRRQPGKMKQGRPKTSWRRSVEPELKELHLSWGEARHAANNKIEADCQSLMFCRDLRDIKKKKITPPLFWRHH